MFTKQRVKLTEAERTHLEDVVRAGSAHARTINHAHILLLCDDSEAGPAWPDERVATALSCNVRTVARGRRRFIDEGKEGALRVRRKSRGRPSKIDGVTEAHLIALACSKPPSGRARWTVRLLADQFVDLCESKGLEPVSQETVRQMLKKNKLRPHRKKQWVIPPEQNAVFVAQMESVVALYAQPHDPVHPVVCLDERPCMLHGNLLEPLSMKPGQDLRYDHEYIRNGSCCVLMAFEPLKAWRHAWVRPQRRRLEFPEVVRELLDQVYPDVNKIRLVCDNLNSHSAASFYKRYPPAEARAMTERVEFVYTPVHGSWLNVIEIEFSAMVRQCLDRRLATLEDVEREVTTWT